MRSTASRVLLAGFTILTDACLRAERPTGPPEIATFGVSGTSLSVAVERRAKHPYLAEYHRSALVRSGDQVLVRHPMFDDSGGHSRTNLYRRSDSVFTLVDAEASYTVNPQRRQILRDSLRLMGHESRGVFLGAFDVDSSRTWRFIPAGERSEREAEFIGR